jgi:hypothetical protein
VDYLKLFLGIILLAVFTWILIQNRKRIGIMHSLMRVDTLLGIIAGLYLTATSLAVLLL